jgi:hypothetical protein
MMKLPVAIMPQAAKIARIPLRVVRLTVPSAVRAVVLDMAAAMVGAGIVALPMLMLGLPG